MIDADTRNYYDQNAVNGLHSITEIDFGDAHLTSTVH